MAARSNIAELSLRTLIEGFARRAWSCVALAALVIGVAATATWLLPRSYESRAVLLLHRDRVEPVLTPGEREPLPATTIREEDLNSEIEILRGRSAAEQVAARIAAGAAHSRGPAQALGSPDEATLHFATALRARPLHRTNMIELTYRSADPRLAAEVVSVWTQVYLDRRSALLRSSETASFFEAQIQTVTADFVRAEWELAEALGGKDSALVGSREGGDLLSAQRTILLQRHGELEQATSTTNVELSQRAREEQALVAQLEHEPERRRSSNRDNRDAVVQELELALERLRLERDAAVQGYQPDSVKVRSLDRQIELARERLAAYGRDSFDGTERNTIHDTLRSRLAAVRTEHETAAARRAALIAEAGVVRDQLQRLGRRAPEIDRLARDVRVLRQRQELYSRKLEEARVALDMNRSRLLNVTVAEPAAQPLRPSSPRVPLNLALACLVAAAACFGRVVLGELADTTVRAPRQLEALGFQYLGSIPDHFGPGGST